MARRNPISQEEKAIGWRVRMIREEQGLSQVAFAAQIGVPSGRLSSYEHGWVPVPYAVGSRVCWYFNTGQRWLATGLLPRKPCLDFEDRGLLPRLGRAHFSSVYHQHLQAICEDQVKLAISVFGKEAVEASNLRDYGPVNVFGAFRRALPAFDWLAANFYMGQLLDMVLVGDRDLLQDVLAALEKSMERMRASLSASDLAEQAWCWGERPVHRKERSPRTETPRPLRPRGDSSKMGKIALDDVSQMGNSLDVKTEMHRLLERLRQLAHQPGRKADVARFLGVSQSRITDWLKGRCEPGGQSTLRLLSWIERQEKAPKQPGAP